MEGAKNIQRREVPLFIYLFFGGEPTLGVQHILSKNGVNMIFSPGMRGGSRKMQLSLEGDNFFMQNSFLGLPSPPPDAIISPLGSKLEI